MTTRRRFLTRIAAAPGVVATGSLWADDGGVSEKALPLHHSGKVKHIIFYYCKGGPALHQGAERSLDLALGLSVER